MDKAYRKVLDSKWYFRIDCFHCWHSMDLHRTLDGKYACWALNYLNKPLKTPKCKCPGYVPLSMIHSFDH